MFARVATFEGIDLDEMESTAEEAQKRLESIFRQMPGWQGTTDLADSSGRVLAITLFDTEENARAAEPIFDEEMPRQLGDLMRGWSGKRRAVEHYRVFFDVRP
jgi:hypothetical protein